MDDIYGFGGPTLPVAWLAALATSDLRLALFGLRFLYGVTRFLHLVGMAAFLGSVILIDARSAGLWPGASLEPAWRPLIGVMHAGFGLAVLTGVMLFVYDPLGAGLHTMFLPKLILIAGGIAFAHGIRRRLFGAVRLRRAAAVLSLTGWVLVVGASTWNHTERPVNVRASYRAGTVGR